MLPWPNIYRFQYRSVLYFQPKPTLHRSLRYRLDDYRSHPKRITPLPVLRYKNNLRLPYIDRRYLHNNSEANILNSSQIADIVIGTRYSGVSVNHNGELEIISEEYSHRNHKTALVLSRASPSLTEYDIRRIFESQSDTPKDLTNRGLEEGVFIYRKDSNE